MTGITIFIHIVPVDTGPGQIMAGSGFQIMIGAGLRSTTADGFMTHGMAGFGFLIMNGDLPGWYGEVEMIIMDGLQWVRGSV